MEQTALRPQQRSESATHDSLSMAGPRSSTASVTTARWERVKPSSAAISMTCSATALTGFGSGRTGERSTPTPRLWTEKAGPYQQDWKKSATSGKAGGLKL